ncbi:glycoside hydrolase family 35 protein [Hamadaea tsunoensis]|uniref:glycoside hydrolase family 35 protein n=1 Tax=Hamadaea tsunoensis TaxID=53368 RepID=UPI0004295939|nr:beta-galactosidase [Hamadaea tsunoensis]
MPASPPPRPRTSTGRRLLGLSLTALLGAATLLGVRAAPVPLRPVAATHTVTFDRYSLSVDGTRTFVWSGEFHPFRLPSPDLWRDVLQKMKASGYNAVSVYFDWAYHSPRAGVYDFTGVRDMDKLLNIAAEVGLYVIARPGPYINAETDAGGFPGWLTTQAGKARTDAADYLAAVDEWLTRIDAILARHQLTNGTGTVILYQIENELAATGTAQLNYLTHLRTKVQSDGITVPIFHNDKGRNGRWVPAGAGVSGTVQGPVDLYAFDGYPGGSCHTDGTVGSPSAAPDWGIYGTGGATGGASASPNTPGFVAEFGGGWFDYWGSNGIYPCTAQRLGTGYERVFYGTNVANRLTLQSFYMTFGGTSWGWLPAPVVYTSYDYGSAVSEARQLRPKAQEMKELGYFLQSVGPITKVDKAAAVTTSSAAVKVDHNLNPDTGTHFYFLVHTPSTATTNDSFTFPIATTDGTYTVPQAGTLRLNGQDAKTLVAGYTVDGQRLVYSTSEILTHTAYANRSVLALVGRDGENGETVLRYASAPTVTVAGGAAVTSTYTASTGDLRLNYTHSGIVQVRVTGGGRPDLLLLIAGQATADTMWRQDTTAGTVLERGPALVRTAAVNGATLALTGDTAAATTLEVWAPPAVTAVTWNGVPVTTRVTSVGSLASTVQLAGPAAVTLPDLSAATWRYSAESPEKATGFDDSTWAAANHTTTNSTTKPPAGQPVLTADDYGFHHGDAWYRGRFTGTAPATVNITYGGGAAGLAQVWLDGTYLGQNVLPAGVAAPATTGTAAFTVPAALRVGGNHVLSVMVRDDGHNEDGGVNDAHKEGRGLISVAYADAGGTAVTLATTWKIQGNAGGETIADTARGPLNNGGLYGERNGWYLPGFTDTGWATRTVPDSAAVAGTAWYRTTFTLGVPAGHDASLGLTIGNPATPRSGGHYRALVFLNGWNLGQYIADVGPQHTFVLPEGLLNPRGTNTLALAVTSNGATGDGLETVALTNLGTVLGGTPVSLVSAPSFH